MAQEYDRIKALHEKYPPRCPTGQPLGPGIPSEAVDELTEECLMLIAEAIQFWLDAGSEREVTLEDEPLAAEIKRHLMDWAVFPDGSYIGSQA